MNYRLLIFIPSVVILVSFTLLSIFISNVEIDSFIPILSLIYFIIASFILYDNYNNKGLIELLNPVIFYTLLWFIPFSVIPVLTIYMDPTSILWTSHQYVDYIEQSQLMAIVSIIFMFLGFKIKIQFNPKSVTSSVQWSKISIYVSIIFLIFLNILSISEAVKRGGFFLGITEFIQEGYTSTMSYILALFGIIRGSILNLFGPLLITAIVYSKYRTKPLKLIFLMLIIFNIILSLFSAHKELLFATFFVVLYYFYYLKHRMSFKKEILIVIFILLLIIIVFPLINLYRGLLFLEYAEGFSVLNMVEILKKALDILDFESDYLFIFIRFDHLNTNLSVIAQTPDEIDYKYGMTYLVGFLAFLAGLPKMPKEGIVGFNNSFAREYGIISSNDYYTGVTLPQMAEIYMNFGFYVLPFFMLLYGVFYRYIYNLLSNSKSPNANLIGFSLFYIFVFQHSALAFSSSMFAVGRVFIGTIILLALLNINRFIKRQ